MTSRTPAAVSPASTAGKLGRLCHPLRSGGWPAGLALTAALLLAGTSASAAKTTRFWNLTDSTITSFELAPTGTQTFGADQTKNDKDGAVDHDERLKIVGVATGTYDARLTDAKGRNCLVKGIAVKEGDVFSIEEKQLTGCTK